MADFWFGGPFRRLLYSRPGLHDWPAGSYAAAMDWIETPSSHLLKLNVPGLGKEDIKIQIEEGNVLSIRGVAPAKDEEAAKEAVWHAAERGKADFVREIALPENVKADQIKAHVDHGVLTIVVPKEPVPARPKPRPIAVSSKL